jgi:hypothetical protein
MKRSILTVFAASAVALAACGGAETEADIEPVQEVQPAPAPAPWPADTMMADTMMMGDTMIADTVPTPQ